jgi:oligopeptide transport system ATP-binding protein
MATLLITHDLGVIAGFCEQVIVLYGGRVMEQSPVDDLFAAPSHPYTRGLLAAIPRLDQPGQSLRAIAGSPPNMTRAQIGCPFAPRCDVALANCATEIPPLIQFTPTRKRACNRNIEEMV